MILISNIVAKLKSINNEMKKGQLVTMYIVYGGWSAKYERISIKFKSV